MTLLFSLWRAVLQPVVPLVAWWAARATRRAGAGRPLTPEEAALARRLGVGDPAAVRVVVTAALPLPGPRWAHRLASALGFPAVESIGLGLGHTVFLHSAWARHPGLLAHDCREPSRPWS